MEQLDVNALRAQIQPKDEDAKGRKMRELDPDVMIVLLARKLVRANRR